MTENSIFLSQVLETLSETVLVLSDRGEIVYANARTKELFDYAPSGLTGKPVQLLLPEIGKQQSYRKVLLGQTTRSTAGEDAWGLTAGGEQIKLMLRFSLLEDKEGRKIICSVREVTEQRKAEQARFAAEVAARQLVQAALDSLPANVAVLDKDGIITHVNKAWTSFAEANGGTSENCGLGMSYRDACAIVSPKGQLALAAIDDVLAGRRAEVSVDYDCHSPEQQRWFRMTARGVPNVWNVGAVVMHVDITDVRLAERERELVAAERSRSTRVEALSQLAAGITHEFNNMVFPVLGMTEVTLASMPADSPLRRNLEIVLQASDSIRELAAKIQALSGQSAEIVEIVDLVQAVPDIVQAMAARRRDWPPIEFLLEGRPMLVALNREDLENVIGILLENATDAQAERGRPIQLVLALENGGNRSLSIMDTGSGMDPDTLERAFDPFFTTKSVGRGKGLGLTIARSIIDAASGEISIASVPGRGTGVTIRLPPPGCPKPVRADEQVADRAT